MGREVRRVPADWCHPKDHNGIFVPLCDGSYTQAASDFLKMANEKGLQEAVEENGCPNKDDYMPEWTKEEATHYQMYENVSEGTPVSPVMSSPQLLAKWLVDNGASAFAGMTADYEHWLKVAEGRTALSAVIINGRLESGVSGL